MTDWEASFFRLVDEYVRSRYSHFVAEFFPSNKQPSSYLICLRSQMGKADARGLYPAKYVAIERSAVLTDGTAARPGASVVRFLDSELK